MKHSMTTDGLFGVDVQSYLHFRATHGILPITHRTWAAYLYMMEIKPHAQVREQPPHC